MNLPKNQIADTLPQQPAAAQQRPRKAGRKAFPGAVIQPVWLVLLAALTMIVFEGAFRKWVFTSGGIWKYLMYFSKDIIFASLLFFPRRSLTSNPLKVFRNWLLPGCVLLCVGATLSCAYGLNPVGAVLTSRATVVLPVLAWLAVPRLAGLPLRWVIWLLVAFTILNFALGVEQNRLPADHILNRYTEPGMDIVAVESGVRATGTFSYISGMSIIAAIGIWAGLALLSLARTQWQRLGAWTALAAGAGCSLAAVSRGPIVIGVAMVAGWLFLSRESISTLTRGLIAGIFGLIIATGFGITPIFSEMGEGLIQRNETASDTFQERAFGQLDETVSTMQMSPFGNGFGTEQVGGQYYSTGQSSFNTAESPLPRLVLETGALGLIGYVIVCAGALLALQRAKREAPTAGGGAALLATQMLLLPMFYGSVIFDHVASAFVWMIFAAVLAAAEIKPNQKLKTEIMKAEIGNQKTDGSGRNWELTPHSVTGKQEEEKGWTQKTES